MTDFCNKLDISRTTFCRKMKSQNLDLRDKDKMVEIIEKNYYSIQKKTNKNES